VQDKATNSGADAALWALRFISGKYQGGEFPLRPNREIIIGRSSDLDMVLVEDMVSRKHAKIGTSEQGVTIQDLGSTNGTFVNGEKIRSVELKDGDRILIGTSIIKLVALNGEQVVNSLTETEARSKMQVEADRRAPSRTMSGSIEEIPLPDLIQLLSTSRKSGVLVLRNDAATGRIYFRKGQIYFASIDEGFEVNPRKALYRMLGWQTGFFELEAPDERTVLDEIQDSTEALLMEGMRQLDEMQVSLEKLPPPSSLINVPHPLSSKLRDLKPEELDVFQVALGGGTLQSLLDRSPQTDLETAQILGTLLGKGYLQSN
jgi:pSer/pThr/pTyr-binding forkhead associated (FHA) protein